LLEDPAPWCHCQNPRRCRFGGTINPKCYFFEEARCDQQSGRVGVTRPTKVEPPLADPIHREGGRVMVDADTHPPGIRGQIIDTIGHRSAEFLDQEVVHPDLLRTPLRPILAAIVAELADPFLLFGVDRDHWLLVGQRSPRRPGQRHGQMTAWLGRTCGTDGSQTLDADRVAACFAEDAVVRDEGGDIYGRSAIRVWAEEVRRKYHFHAEVDCTARANQGPHVSEPLAS
jgi:hypothetical protein